VRIECIVWLDSIVEKLDGKHHVSIEEVEEVFSGKPHFRYVERGHRRGEDVYAAIGKTESGRNLIVFFVYKPRTKEALVISARTPSRRERNL
jgi:uncharacterized DUF497 family protein